MPTGGSLMSFNQLRVEFFFVIQVCIQKFSFFMYKLMPLSNLRHPRGTSRGDQHWPLHTLSHCARSQNDGHSQSHKIKIVKCRQLKSLKRINYIKFLFTMHYASIIKDSGLYIFMYALAKNKYIPIIKVRKPNR